MDLVREILMAIEMEGAPSLASVPDLPGHSDATVTHHVALLLEAGLVTAIDASSMDGRDFIEIGLTWHGHEFLESVRDPEVWRKTKAGAAKVGSFSIGLLADLAKAAITAKAQSLGLPIG
jgi:hypothetical protein